MPTKRTPITDIERRLMDRKLLILLLACLGALIGAELENSDNTSVSDQILRVRSSGRNLVLYRRKGTDFEASFVRTATGKTVASNLEIATTNSGLSGDGKTFVELTSNHRMRAWDVVTGRQIATAHLPQGLLRVNHDGSHFQVRSQEPAGDRKIIWRVYSTRDGTERLTDSMPGRQWRGLVLSHDGRYAATSRLETTTIHPIGKGRTRKIKGSEVVSMGLTLDGTSFSRDERGGSVIVFDFQTGRTSKTLNHPRTARFISSDLSGNRILTWCRDQKARVWDREKGHLICEVDAPEQTPAMSSDGRVLGATTYRDSKTFVTLYEVKSGKVLKRVEAEFGDKIAGLDHEHTQGYLWLHNYEGKLKAIPYSL